MFIFLEFLSTKPAPTSDAHLRLSLSLDCMMRGRNSSQARILRISLTPASASLAPPSYRGKRTSDITPKVLLR